MIAFKSNFLKNTSYTTSYTHNTRTDREDHARAWLPSADRTWKTGKLRICTQL